jgi:hypothetical protein
MNIVFAKEYVITNLDGGNKWFVEQERMVIPKERGNLTFSDIICKIELREVLSGEYGIATEQDKRERPEDIIENNMIAFNRTLLGYFKCADIKINSTTDYNNKKEPEKSIFDFKNIKVIIICILIIIVVVGIMFAFSLKEKQKSESEW